MRYVALEHDAPYSPIRVLRLQARQLLYPKLSAIHFVFVSGAYEDTTSRGLHIDIGLLNGTLIIVDMVDDEISMTIHAAQKTLNPLILRDDSYSFTRLKLPLDLKTSTSLVATNAVQLGA